MSEDLKRRGFRFVGSTICYAFMQACGLVNHHLVGCFRHYEWAKRRDRRGAPIRGGPVPGRPARGPPGRRNWVRRPP